MTRMQFESCFVAWGCLGMQNMRGRQLILLQCTYKEIEGVIASKYTRTCTRYIAWKHRRTYTCVCIHCLELVALSGVEYLTMGEHV